MCTAQSFAPALKLHYVCPAATPDPTEARALASYYSAALAAAETMGLATRGAPVAGGIGGGGAPERAHFHSGRLTVGLMAVLLVLVFRRVLVARLRAVKGGRPRSASAARPLLIRHAPSNGV